MDSFIYHKNNYYNLTKYGNGKVYILKDRRIVGINNYILINKIVRIRGKSNLIGKKFT